MTAFAAAGAFDLILQYAPAIVSTVAEAEQLIERLADKKRTLEQAASDQDAADARLDADLAAAGLLAGLAQAVPPPVPAGGDAAPAPAANFAAARVVAALEAQAAEILRLLEANQQLTSQLAAEQAAFPPPAEPDAGGTADPGPGPVEP